MTNGTTPIVSQRERSSTTSTNYSFARVSVFTSIFPYQPTLARRKGLALDLRFDPDLFFLPRKTLDLVALDFLWTSFVGTHTTLLPRALNKSTDALTKLLRLSRSGLQLLQSVDRAHVNCEPACHFLNTRIPIQAITLSYNLGPDPR